MVPGCEVVCTHATTCSVIYRWFGKPPKKEKVRKKLEFPKHDIFEVIFGTLTPVSDTSGNTLYTAIKRKSLFPLSLDSRLRYVQILLS